MRVDFLHCVAVGFDHMTCLSQRDMRRGEVGRAQMCLHGLEWLLVLHHCPEKTVLSVDAGSRILSEAEYCSEADLNPEPSLAKPSRTTADAQDQMLGAACQ